MDFFLLAQTNDFNSFIPAAITIFWGANATGCSDVKREGYSEFEWPMKALLHTISTALVYVWISFG